MDMLPTFSQTVHSEIYLQLYVRGFVQNLNGCLAITQARLCNLCAIFHGCKNDNFQMKKVDNFLIFDQNIDRGYTLEPVLTTTHNLCFRAKIRKNMYTTVNPSFTI